MTSRRRTQLLLCVVAVQVLVPFVVLMGDPPSRFGFQMFGGYEVGNTVTVRDDSGTEIPFSEGDLWHVPLRPELDWSRHLPALLCAKVEGAAAVDIFQHSSGRQVVPCP